jgi:hypothetical protein
MFLLHKLHSKLELIESHWSYVSFWDKNNL